jgi:putative oxidoreductase
MVIKLLNTVNWMRAHAGFGKFLLRLAVGGLMLFHGLHKLFAGIDGISGMLIAKGFPGFFPLPGIRPGGSLLSERQY